MCARVRALGPEALVSLLEGGVERVLLIDSRPFVDFNTSHVLEAVNVNCSKLMKRRLQQDKVQVSELLQSAAKRKLQLEGQEVVVYDHSSRDASGLSPDAFLSVLLVKLEKSFPSVHLLSGGFVEFSRLFPGLCEGKASVCAPLVSAPCVPASSSGPTRILTHLYLGCQRDVLNQELMQQNQISFVLNASNTCPKPDFIADTHFLRVPVSDSFCEKILPWLERSVDFIERAKASEGRVLVHCLAGISRSATIAIAYIMKRMDMSLDEAYRFVKEKRPTISPNFNFLGQLLDFEKKLKSGRACASGDARPSGELLEPLTLPCVLTGVSEERLLARALCGLALPQESTRPQRLDVTPCCDTAPRDRPERLQRSGSLDESPVPPVPRLKGWHSDLLLGVLRSGAEVRRRGRAGDSRRSWHEESSFEKQLKRRSCQMELGDGADAREDRGNHTSFTGSLEIIEVS